MATIAERLILFTRFPEPGTTKTRLIPAFGPEGAAELQRELTEQALCLARTLRERTGAEIEVRFTGAAAERFHAWLGDDLRCQEQVGNDLGARMANAFADAFAEGSERVVLIGIDCPFLRAHHLQHALAALSSHDVVLGPAVDGGYTLVGLSAPRPELFREMTWSTGKVFQTTCERIRANSLRLALLPRLSDIDRPEDVAEWREHASADAEGPALSVIIPTLDCEATVAGVLRSVLAENHVEAIVIDGGSEDDTVNRASESGATAIHATRGRGEQMNAGVDIATAEQLLFLHGDTVLPAGYRAAIDQVLTRDGACLGAFTLGIDANGAGFRAIEWLANRRSRWLSQPYGDQGLFLTRSHFETLGRFPQEPFLEDLTFVRTARRAGTVVTVPLPVRTAATRWQRKGVLRTTLTNQLILLGHRLGFSPERLKKIY